MLNWIGQITPVRPSLWTSHLPFAYPGDFIDAETGAVGQLSD